MDRCLTRPLLGRLERAGKNKGKCSARRTIFLGIKHLREAGVFLQEGKVFVVARVIAVFRTKLDSHLQILHRGICFAGQAVERRERIVNVVRLGRGLSSAIQALSCVIPAADIHHRHAALIVLVCGLGILLVTWFHALFGNLQVHASAIGKFLAGPLKDLFEFLLGFGKLLLVKQRQRFVVELELRLNAGIDQLDAAPLGRMLRS